MSPAIVFYLVPIGWLALDALIWFQVCVSYNMIKNTYDRWDLDLRIYLESPQKRFRVAWMIPVWVIAMVSSIYEVTPYWDWIGVLVLLILLAYVAFAGVVFWKFLDRRDSEA